MNTKTMNMVIRTTREILKREDMKLINQQCDEDFIINQVALDLAILRSNIKAGIDMHSKRIALAKSIALLTMALAKDYRGPEANKT